MYIIFLAKDTFGMCGFNNYTNIINTHGGRLIEWEIHDDVRDALDSQEIEWEKIPAALHDVMDMEVLPQWTQVVIDTKIQRHEDGGTTISHTMSRNACGTLDLLSDSGLTWQGEGWNYYLMLGRWDVPGGAADVARLKAMFGGVLDEVIDQGLEVGEDGEQSVDMEITFSLTEMLTKDLSARGLEEEYVGWPRRLPDYELVEDHALYELRYDSKHNSAVVCALAELEMKVARMLAGIKAEMERQRMEASASHG